MRIFLIPLGIIFILFSAGIATATHLALTQSQFYQGTIIELVKHIGRSGGEMYSPLISYDNADGEKITFDAGIPGFLAGIGMPSFQKGEMIWVAFNPATKESKLLSFSALYSNPLTFFFLGIALVFSGIPFGSESGILRRIYSLGK